MPILMSDGALLNLADKSNEELYATEAGGVFITDSQAEAMIAESQAFTHALHTEGAWKESTA